MIIYVCDRCGSKKESSGDFHDVSTFANYNMCKTCTDGFADLELYLNGYVKQCLDAYRRRDTQPEMKKLW